MTRPKSERFTTPAEAMEHLRKTMRTSPPGEQLYRCGRCQDTGWEPIGPEVFPDRRPVRRCSRGCDLPKSRLVARLEQPPTGGKRFS